MMVLPSLAKTKDQSNNLIVCGGNQECFDGHLDIYFAGFGAVAEGPLLDSRGSWLFSARGIISTWSSKRFPPPVLFVRWLRTIAAQNVFLIPGHKTATGSAHCAICR